MDTQLNKFKVLYSVETGDIPLTQAARLLDTKPSDILRSLTVYRENLLYLIEAADRLSVQHMTQTDRKEIAEEVALKLDITRRQVNRMMKTTGVAVLPTYKVNLKEITRENAQEKWKIRFDCALSVIAGADSMDAAAEISEVTSRQMYRWVTRFLKNQGMGIKDLKQLPIGKRKKIAKTIEEIEGKAFEIEQKRIKDGNA